jgi:hypothetical protein
MWSNPLARDDIARACNLLIELQSNQCRFVYSGDREINILYAQLFPYHNTRDVRYNTGRPDYELWWQRQIRVARSWTVRQVSEQNGQTRGRTALAYKPYREHLLAGTYVLSHLFTVIPHMHIFLLPLTVKQAWNIKSFAVHFRVSFKYRLKLNEEYSYPGINLELVCTRGWVIDPILMYSAVYAPVFSRKRSSPAWETVVLGPEPAADIAISWIFPPT